MEEKSKVIRTGIIFIAVLIIGIAIYYFFFYTKGKEIRPADVTPPPVADKVLPEEERHIPLPPVALDKSDDFIRQLALELSSHPRLVDWLKSKNLIRKFVAAVDNIANGQSPRAHIDFFSPRGDFKAVKRGNSFYVDPAGYARYNITVDVFISLDAKACASLYRGLKPLFQEAYRDLGYPQQDFDDTLLRAIIELLKTPVIEGNILVERQVLTYIMPDSKLEGLSEAQKHLLRMGPENVETIQAKLRELALALGFPEYRLPQTQSYYPERRRP